MPIGDLLASISGEPSPTTSNRPLLPPKRKSSDGDALRRPADKLQKTSNASARPVNSPRPCPNGSSRPGGVDSSMARMKLNAPPTNNRASSVPTSTTSAKVKNGQPTPTPVGDAKAVTKAPPKKGSFAEIMARGKQNQVQMGQVGKILHKRIEKPVSKRERADLEAQKSAKIAKNIGPGGKFSNTPGAKAIASKISTAATPNGKTGVKLGKAGKAPAPEPEKKIKKAALATTGYAGTARPRAGGVKAGQKPSHTSSSRDRDRFGRKPPALGSRYDRYESYDDEEDLMEEGEEEDDQGGYASDVSSDMEAAAFEVDEEEQMAAKIARKEDAEALAEENRLKREKAERRKHLQAMATKAKNKR